MRGVFGYYVCLISVNYPWGPLSPSQKLLEPSKPILPILKNRSIQSPSICFMLIHRVQLSQFVLLQPWSWSCSCFVSYVSAVFGHLVGHISTSVAPRNPCQRPRLAAAERDGLKRSPHIIGVKTLEDLLEQRLFAGLYIYIKDMLKHHVQPGSAINITPRVVHMFVSIAGHSTTLDI